MTDLFADQQLPEQTLRDELTQKWKEKFPTADEELIKSKVDSDLYIKSLERQKDELRLDWMKAQEEIQARANLQDLIDRLNEKVTPPATPPTVPPESPAPQIDPKKIEDLIHSKILETKRLEIETDNFNKVQSKLSERFGSHAGNVLAEQARTLGLSKDDVNSLAKKSPEAFFRMLGLDNQHKDTFMSPPRSDVRNDHFAPRAVKRTWSYYQDMKAKNPNQYWDPKTQLQMHRDSEQLGPAFEDGDFNS